MAEEQKNKKCIKSRHQWTGEECDKLLQAVMDLVQNDPEKIEKPTGQKFYENLFISSDNPIIPLLSELGWEAVKKKVRRLKKSFLETKNWMDETGAELLKDGKEYFVRDYILKKCPHYDKCKQLFGQYTESLYYTPSEVEIETKNLTASKKQKDTRIVSEKINVDEKQYECDICQKHFLSERTMLTHRYSHNTSKKFRYCEICRLKVKGLKELSEHMSVHNENEQIKCKYCSKTFLRKNYRDLHERTHTGERPFQCTDCGKTFIRANHLIVHTRYHTGTKPYKCTYCDKSFYTNTYLKDHLVVHTGDKPFTCEICKKTFGRMTNLKVHLRTHSKDKNYTCHICEKSFKHQNSLKNHKRNHGSTVSFYKNNNS